MTLLPDVERELLRVARLPPPAAPASGARSRHRARRNPRLSPTAAVLLTGVAVAVSIGVVFVFVFGGARTVRGSHAAPMNLGGAGLRDAPVGLDPAGVIHVGGSPQALLATGASLWVATPTAVVRLGVQSGATIGRTPVPTNGVSAGLAWGAGSVWLAPTGASQLLRIDPTDDRLVADVHIGAEPRARLSSLGGGVALAAGQIWVSRVSNRPRGDVVSIDPTTDRIAAAPVTVGAGPDSVVSAFGSLWVENTSAVLGDHTRSSSLGPSVSRIDPRTRRVNGEPFSGTVVPGFGSLWVQSGTGSGDAAVVRVDPITGRALARIEVPRLAGLATGDGRVWAISSPRSRSASTFQPIGGTAALRQIDPRTDRVVGAPVPLAVTEPVSIVVSGRQLWIADYQRGTVTHFRLSPP